MVALLMPEMVEAELQRELLEDALRPVMWTPQVGPQTSACESTADEILYGGEPGGGKALAVSTLLPTPDGWITMGDVEVGDMLFDEHGLLCRVLAATPVMHDHVVYEVVFDDGTVIAADADHRWFTITRADRQAALKRNDVWRERRRLARPTRGTGKRPDLAAMNAQRAATAVLESPTIGAVRTTEEIRSSLTRPDGSVNHCIPLAMPLDLPRADLPIAPYTFGAWLGDGTSSAGSITGVDPEILDAIRADGYTVTKRADPMSHGIPGIRPMLIKLGVLGNKHIPAVYLRASYEQRLGLLQGIMDTDGHVTARGACEIQLSNGRLLRDVWHLLMSLGIKATVTEGRATLNGKDCGSKWRVKFMTSQPVARLPRKAARLPATVRATTRQRYIVAVRPIPSEPVRCISVDSPSHLYLAGYEMVPTHNTDWLLGMALTKHTRSHIFRRDAGQLTEMTDRLRSITAGRGRVTESPRPRWRYAEQLVEMAGIETEADAWKWQGRASDLKAFDELTQFSKTKYLIVSGWGRSIDPSQKVQTIASCNPPVDEDALWVVERWAPWLDPSHPNPAASGEIRWFVAIGDEDVECEDGQPFEFEGETYYPSSRTFIRARLGDNAYLGDDYRRKIDQMPEPMRTIFKTSDFMALLQTSHPFQVIPTDWIRQAQKRWTPERPELPNGRRVPQSCVALDVAEGGKDRTVKAKRYGDWFAPLESKPGIQTPHAKDSADFVEPDLLEGGYVIVDGDGVGGQAYGILHEKFKARARSFRGVKPTLWRDTDWNGDGGQNEFFNVRAAAWWSARMALDPKNPRKVALPPGNDLLAELAAPRWFISGQKIQLEQKPKIIERLGRSPDLADAVVMALWDGASVEIPESYGVAV